MQRILLSLAVIIALGGGAVASTGAFFNDTETSTGNTFAAGDIDLKIDNSSYAIDFNIPTFAGTSTGALVANPANSWTLTDLVAGTHKFFNFDDVKPGDYGEDTISIHVGSNNAWMCAAARITDDSDQSCTEPELSDDGTCSTPGLGQGELDSVLNFAFWADDGDNVYEPGQSATGTPETIFLGGPLSALASSTQQIALATPTGGAFGTNPVPGGSTVYIGKIWCAGTLTPTGLVQNGTNTGSPLTLGTGFTCDGTLVNNAAQTDQVQGDMQFYAVQARNNPNFSCASYVPTWPTPTPTSTPTPTPVPETATVTVDKEVAFTDLAIEGVDVSDFALTIDGPGAPQIVIDNIATPGLPVGVYSISEVYSGNPANVIFNASFSGGCSEVGDTGVGTMNVIAGINPTCVITNSVSLAAS